jgi:hypothetical protein
MVKITGDDYDGKDEMYCDWYKCPKCYTPEIAIGFKYCPMCGEKIEWNIKR